MINFNRTKFIKSAYNLEDHLYDYQQILFIGKSNVGKSSLINAITNQNKLAYVSKTPGMTKLVNYYLVDEKFYLVDVPGFGYRKISRSDDKFVELMDNYLLKNPCLKYVFYLIDSRRGIDEDAEEVISYIASLNYPLYIIFTKADKLNQSEKAKIRNNIASYNIKEYQFFSNVDEKLINDLQKKIVEVVFK